jgi:ATP-dependent exoDNAse (exonuclease V) beta subunit
VERAIAALHDAQLVGDGVTIRLEYPIAFARDGAIVSGFLDFVSAPPGGTVVVDFKTDQPAVADLLAAYPAYVRQVETYAAVIGARRAALLFTATGELAWLPDRS